MNKNINRRSFLSILSGCAMTPFIPKVVSGNTFKENPLIYRNPILAAFNNQMDKEKFDHLNNEEIDRLEYALDQIKPSNHQEFAFIIAILCFRSDFNPRQYIDEYRRRKFNQISLGPDHPVLELNNRNTPNTYRIIIYRQQIMSLIEELTSIPYRRCFKAFINLYFPLESERCWGNLKKMLNEKYLAVLDDNEIKTIFNAMCYTISIFRDYLFCSNIASRAIGSSRLF